MSKKKSKKNEQQASHPPPPPPPPPQPAAAEESGSESESEPESESRGKQMPVKRKRENEVEANLAKEGSESESDDEPPVVQVPKKKKQKNGIESDKVVENGEKKKAPRKKEAAKKAAEEKGKKDDDVVEVVKGKPDVKRWTPKDEILLAKQMLEDVNESDDLDLRNKPKTDNYWSELCESLQGRLSNDFSAEQVFDKHKRMKNKFKLYEASKTTKSGKKRSRADNELHEIFKQLWGDSEETATPTKSTKSVAADSDDEEEVSGDTSGLPLLSAVKKEQFSPDNGLHENGHRQPKHAANGAGPSGAMITQEQLGTVANFGELVCSGVQSMIKAYQDSMLKVLQATSEEDRKRRKEERKRVLKDQVAEYARLKARLRLVMELCEQEEEAAKRMLEDL